MILVGDDDDDGGGGGGDDDEQGKHVTRRVAKCKMQ